MDWPSHSFFALRGRPAKPAAKPRLRLIVCAVIVGLIFGTVEFGKPVEDVLRTGRASLRSHAASGDIVIVALDDRSLKAFDNRAWSRGQYARLIDGVRQLGARRTFLDLDLSLRSDPAQDKLLEDALARGGGKLVLAVRSPFGAIAGARMASVPLPQFRRHAQLAEFNLRPDFQGWIWKLPYATRTSGGTYPSFAAKLAGVDGAEHARPAGRMFRVDYAIDPRSIRTLSAADLVMRRIPRGSLAGKDVLIGTTAARLSDNRFLPSHGLLPEVYLHALGAETLKAGVPTRLSWLLTFAFALLISVGALAVAKLRLSLIVSAGGMLALLALPLALEARQVATDIVPALFLLCIVTGMWTWRSLRRSYRVKGTVNQVSGLPNLDALRGLKVDHNCILIAARIHNYPQIASALPEEAEHALIAQIASRLTLGAPDQTVFQGDEGIFAWFSDQESIDVIGDHLDALHGFFRNSVSVDDKQIDLTLSFGVDASNDRSTANRLGSALVACDEAADEGRRWKAYDPVALKDVAWKLSLLGQLDRAIDSGDFWVAFQPKLDLRSGCICGAEALARWTHPEKGAIAPLDFILAAEQNDRIEKLTRFVLDEAIKAAAAINAVGVSFDIAVNLSARLIADERFADVVEALLRQHGLEPKLLTLEVTETAAMGSGCDDLVVLGRLRSLGVKISIDDYGTGLSTLEYFKKIPATEIKVDRSFVAAMTRSHSDRLMVNSTIQLAHSMGRSVVAEGIEDQQTMDALAAMGCDQAQGFFIGRPMTLYAFTDALYADRRKKIAKRA